MPTFGDRLREWADDKGMLQADLAAALEISPQLYSNYVNNRRTPTFERLLEIAGRLAVSCDWLCGRANFPVWGPEVYQMRLWLPDEVKSIDSPDLHARMLTVIKLIQSRVKAAEEDWFMAGILKVSVETYRRFLISTDFDVNTVMLRRFSDFTGLSIRWLMNGDVSDLRRPAEIGEWTGLVERFIRWGITVDEANAEAEWLREQITLKRRLRS